MFRDKTKDGTTRLTGGSAGGGGDPGDPGLSAYEIAVLNGFVGTEVDWLASLQGDDGDPGADSIVPGPPGSNADYVPAFTRGDYLTVAAYTMRLYITRNCTIDHVRISVGSAPTGASIKVDVNLNGVTVFTTQANRPEIAIGGFTDTSIPDVTALVAGDYLTVDIDQVGSTYPGADLVVQVVTA